MVVVVLLFGGGIVVVESCNYYVFMISIVKSRCLIRSRWQGVGHPGAWRLQIADLEGVVCAMVACRVGGGNDAAAMSVVRRAMIGCHGCT